MIPRYFPRKNRSFRQAINYVLREQVKHGFIIKHNLPGNSPAEWVQAFQANENQRRSKSRRKDAVRIRHIVLSWNGKDPVTNEAMADMTRHFMITYSPHAMYLAVAHAPDELHEHPHVHVIAGGTDIFGQALHLTNAKDRQLKVSAEAYQREHYPEYTHSRVEHGQGKKSRQREYWVKKRGKTLYKEKLSRTLDRVFSQSDSFADFLDGIEKAGLVPWRDKRNGKVVGITYQGRKHRFRTLGIGREKLRELERERSWDRGL